MDTRTGSFFRFEDLRIYNKAVDYANWVITNAKTKDEYAIKFVVKPWSKAALKVAKTIAEGSSRSKHDLPDFLRDAKLYVRQCVVCSTLALRNGVISEQTFEQSKESLVEMTKMLGAMIVSLTRTTPRQVSNNVPTNEYNLEDNAPTPDIEFEY